MAIPAFLLVVGLLAFASPVHAQDQTGFISIDCGLPGVDAKYQDDRNQIYYSSDEKYIDTGVNENISIAIENYPSHRRYFNVRSFPDGNRNCYTLQPVTNGKKYLIRASFLYGNYDGRNNPPTFDLYVGTNPLVSITFDASNKDIEEIIMKATMNFISVCLVNTGLGIPFISSLELRPLEDLMYRIVDLTQSLLLHTRNDVGLHSDLTIRYPNDHYDRLWQDWNGGRLLNTSLDVGNEDGYLKPPSKVMKTANVPSDGLDWLSFNWKDDYTDSKFFICLYFAELEEGNSSAARNFSIKLNGQIWDDSVTPEYLRAIAYWDTKPWSGLENNVVTLTKLNSSTLPPILNAYEIYYVKETSQPATQSEDVNAMMDIKKMYGVKRNWMGDPCLPTKYSWDGLKCSDNGFQAPRIDSLNLSSFGLSGEISSSLANLTSLVSLDLSYNNLRGEVPKFLAALPSLKFLNLSGNEFEEQLPNDLIERSNNGSLSLRYDANLNPPVSEKKGKKNLLLIIILSVTAVLVLLSLMIITTWRRQRATRSIANANPTYGSNRRKCNFKSLSSENRHFTYSEVVRMTDNFERVIGVGGFGRVYTGHMEDGTQVAIKLLSKSSSQGSKEFTAEAQLLMRVHHRNLVSLIGYCADGKEMALIYEYMAEGNLKQHLSGTESRAKALDWGQRLLISIDIAQGLEYLHNGCKPAIVHRDVKTANILLNEKLEAKLADFGLSKFFPQDEVTQMYTTVKGTLGYLDPEYCVSQKLNEKSDVFSFGIVLLELITGRPALIKISNTEKINLFNWVRPILESGDINNLVDPRLQGDYNTNSVWKALDTAMACTESTSIQRPAMRDVVTELKECLSMGIAPQRTLSIKMDVLDANSSTVFNPVPR